MTRATYVISGVCCATEEETLCRSLASGLATGEYRFNPVTGELSVDESVDADRVIALVRRSGFAARPVRQLAHKEPFFVRHRAGLEAGVAAVLTAAGLLAGALGVAPLVERALLLGAMIIAGRDVVRRALGAVRVRSLDMNVLMTVAAAGAVILGRWGEGAAVLVLFSLSLMLESYSTARTRRAVRSLLELSPDRARVVRGQEELDVAASSVAPGSSILVRPGERIPLDGVVAEGLSSVNEAAITGESVPVDKLPGNSVYAGSMNERGSLVVRTTSRSDDTRLARVVQQIEESQQRRAPVQLFIDRFARVYTPVVLGIAAAVAVIPPLLFHAPLADWVYRGLVLLVVACPCALVIATPVTLVSALTNAARHGILVRGGRILETVARVQAVAFDKTGTLTRGRPVVTDVEVFDTLSEDGVLRLMAAVESRSEHHLASAVVARAAARGLVHGDLAVEGFESFPGKGVTAVIDGTSYYLGNTELAAERGFLRSGVTDVADRLSREGKTVLIFGTEGRPMAVVGAQDTVRQRGAEAVAALRRAGVHHTAVLSGDREEVTARLAGEAGVEEHRSSLLPDEKVAAVEDLKRQWGTVAMVGDGVNDAPALAASSVGIAMGVTGTDTALETADVVLMSDDLGKLPHLFSLSRAAMRVVRQNIVLALGLKVLFFALTAVGEATLWMAVLADDGAAIAVILNGIRLLSFGSRSR